MEPEKQLSPEDVKLLDKIVGQLKSQGIFDQFRKECMADVDTKVILYRLICTSGRSKCKYMFRSFTREHFNWPSCH